MIVVQYRKGWKRFAAIWAATASEENHEEDARGDQVTEVHRHRQRVAAGLAERGGGDLDDPEQQGDFRQPCSRSDLSVVIAFSVLIHR